jgi:hypothetical protein
LPFIPKPKLLPYKLSRLAKKADPPFDGTACGRLSVIPGGRDVRRGAYITCVVETADPTPVSLTGQHHWLDQISKNEKSAIVQVPECCAINARVPA